MTLELTGLFGYNIRDKNVREEINNINDKIKGYDSQLTAIANKTVVENGKLYLVKKDGTKIDAGTELPIQDIDLSNYIQKEDGKGLSSNDYTTSEKQKLAGLNNYDDTELRNLINNKSSNIVKTYNTEAIGELFEQPSGNTYLAWGAGNLKYDANIDKYVCIVNVADKHVFTTLKPYICYINPVTFEMSELKEITVTGVTLDEKAICNFTILDDNSYMIIALIGSANHRLISTDNGTTWTDSGAITGNTSQHFWAIYKLSTGRLIGSIDVANKGLWYSDDNGVSWTNVIPSGTLGNYNAEGCVIELGNNKLICVARKNMSGQGVSSSGDSDKAIISYSTDNGTSWSAWQESTSISMNASCCTAIVHDNLVELFAGNRWYHRGDYVCNEYANTGKNGAIIHYTATIENALLDNFTNNGIVVYANTPSDNSDTAQDFHCPCVAIKGYDMLLTYFDRTGDANAESTNYYFVRGSLNQLSYAPNDKIVSSAFSFSSKYEQMLFDNLTSKVATLQYALSQIPDSGVDAPIGTLIWTAEYNVNEKGAIPTEGVFFDNVFTGTGLNGTSTLGTDENSIKYWKLYRKGILIVPTKANFAIEMTIMGNSSVLNSCLGIVDNSAFYGVAGNKGGTGWTNECVNSAGTLQIAKADFIANKYKFKIVKNGGVIKVYCNDVEYTSSAWSTNPPCLASYVSTSATTYVVYYANYNYAIYNLKYGEWDS